MKVVIKFSRREELKGLPILLRHSPGMMLRDGSYVVDSEATRALELAGVKFKVVTSEASPPIPERAEFGERI